MPRVGQNVAQSIEFWSKAVCIDRVGPSLKWLEVLQLIQTALRRTEGLSITPFKVDKAILLGASREEAKLLG